MVKRNLNDTIDPEPLVSSFRVELGNRLREVENEFKNRAEAAKIAGVAKSTLQNWIEGKRDASFEKLANLAQASNKSLDWLATGKASGAVTGAPLDQELLQMVIEEIEIFVDECSLSWSPAKKSRVIIAAYDMLSDEEAPEDASKAGANLGHLLKAAV